MTKADQYAKNFYIPTPKLVKLSNAEVYYREYGEGYPVICLPSWMSSSIVYSPLSAQIDLKKVKLIALDMPGWGNRSSISGTIDIDNYISLVRDVVDKLKLNKYSMIGYSFGGVIAQGVVTVENLKPEHLFLVSTLNGGFDIFGKIRMKTAIKGLKAIKKSVDRQERLKNAYLFARRASISYSLKATSSDVEFIDLLLKDLGPISVPNAMDSIYSLYGRSFLSNLLKEIDTTLIMGNRDHIYVKKGMKKIAKYIGEEINIIEGNHHHMVFRPQETAKFIKTVLSC